MLDATKRGGLCSPSFPATSFSGFPPPLPPGSLLFLSRSLSLSPPFPFPFALLFLTLRRYPLALPQTLRRLSFFYSPLFPRTHISFFLSLISAASLEALSQSLVFLLWFLLVKPHAAPSFFVFLFCRSFVPFFLSSLRLPLSVAFIG